MILIGVTPAVSENEINQYSQINVDYMNAIVRAGGVPVLLPLPDKTSEANMADALFEHLDGILFTGGGDLDPRVYGCDNTFSDMPEPQRDSLEIPLMRRCVCEKKPFFGICRGIQVMNAALGGTLVQDIAHEIPGASKHDRSDVPRTPVHCVSITADTLLSRILGKESIKVNSRHHQAAGRIAEGLVVCAQSEDSVIEGLWLPDHPFALGVQWHPESLAQADADAQKLFNAFVEACKK